MAETSSTTAGAQTLLRGLAVLNAVYNGCHDLKSIGEFTGTTRSTTHRLVTVLVEQRYLRHVPTQGYQLGAKLIEFGARALESTSLYEIAQPVLQRLARYTLDTVHLGIVEGDEVLYLEKINSQRGLEMRSRPGHRMPLAITGIGKALILNRTEEEWRTLFKTCGDETKLGAFIQNMRRYAASGFALIWKRTSRLSVALQRRFTTPGMKLWRLFLSPVPPRICRWRVWKNWHLTSNPVQKRYPLNWAGVSTSAKINKP